MDFAEINGEKNTETVTISRAEYEAQQAKIAKLENQVTLLMDALRLSRHKQFGASSEKSDEAVMEQLSYLFNEAEAFAPAEAGKQCRSHRSGNRAIPAALERSTGMRNQIILRSRRRRNQNSLPAGFLRHAVRFYAYD